LIRFGRHPNTADGAVGDRDVQEQQPSPKVVDGRVQRAFELVRAGEKSAGQVAKDLDLAGSALRDWVKQADDAARTGKLVEEDERAELKRLREENRELRIHGIS
jgi:Transposase